MAEHSQQTLELFAQIGARLRVAREERGYTIQELSSQTRINQSFLDKIEGGDLAGLPGLAFVKGFIRNYISVLEIKDAELDEALSRLGPAAAREAATQLHPSNPQVLDTEAPRPAYLKMGLFAVVAVLILWVGYVLFSGSDAPPPVVTQPPAPAALGTGGTPGPAMTPAAPPAGTPSAGPPAAPAPPTAPAAPGTAPPAPAPPPPRTGAAPGAPGRSLAAPEPRAAGPLEGRQKLELTIRGLERTWVRLSIDRAPPIDVLLQPAETVAWEANQEIRLTIGRSNGVAVYLNGEEILLPAEPNRLIPNLVLNKLTLLRLEN
jgi:cytoskeleton protein RodZ